MDDHPSAARTTLTAAPDHDPSPGLRILIVDEHRVVADLLSVALSMQPARIGKLAPGTAVVLMSTRTDPLCLVRAAQAGAAAFVPRTGSLVEMIDVLRRVRADPTSPAPPVSRAVALTHRESDVLRRLSQGSTTTSIALSMGITVHTCRSYIKSLIRKLDAHSRLEAVVKARDLGLL